MDRRKIVEPQWVHLSATNDTLAAALALNQTHIAVVFVDDDAGTSAGFSLPDNQAPAIAEWDKQALDALLCEVNITNDPRLDQILSALAKEEKRILADPALPMTPAAAERLSPVPATTCYSPHCGHEFLQVVTKPD